MLASSPRLVEVVRMGTKLRDQALTRRECEMLRLLAHGFSNKQVALRVGLSTHTVDGYLGIILAKLGAVNRTQAVALALRRGLLE
jgi:DNA-binding CsgD family transcriptional regulator